MPLDVLIYAGARLREAVEALTTWTPKVWAPLPKLPEVLWARRFSKSENEFSPEWPRAGVSCHLWHGPGKFYLCGTTGRSSHSHRRRTHGGHPGEGGQSPGPSFRPVLKAGLRNRASYS